MCSVICKYYAILYKGLENTQILVLGAGGGGILEPIPHEHQGKTMRYLVGRYK